MTKKDYKWKFDISPDTVVVTSTYIMKKGMPILYVTHEYDEEEGIIWQFHCGNGDYREEVLMLVCLEEVIDIDKSIEEIADIPQGYCAKRKNNSEKWEIMREE